MQLHRRFFLLCLPILFFIASVKAQTGIVSSAGTRAYSSQVITCDGANSGACPPVELRDTAGAGNPAATHGKDFVQIGSSDALPKDFFKLGETPHSHATGNFTAHARLQALNKVTAHTLMIEFEKGQEIRFGTLTISLESCWKSSPEEMPESAALLKITEQKIAEEKKQIFFGWMFASSPSVNALEHSVYDVVVLECY